jgi:hypothetical protein
VAELEPAHRRDEIALTGPTDASHIPTGGLAPAAKPLLGFEAPASSDRSVPVLEPKASLPQAVNLSAAPGNTRRFGKTRPSPGCWSGAALQKSNSCGGLKMAQISQMSEPLEDCSCAVRPRNDSCYRRPPPRVHRLVWCIN